VRSSKKGHPVLQDFLANAVAHEADEHNIDVAVKEALQVLLEVPQPALCAFEPLGDCSANAASTWHAPLGH